MERFSCLDMSQVLHTHVSMCKPSCHASDMLIYWSRVIANRYTCYIFQLM